MNKKQCDELDALREDLRRAQDLERRYHDYVCRVDVALEGLMRDVLAEAIGPLSHPNSIAAGRLIAAVAKASAKIHEADQL
jgi:hypothetical protein